MLQIYNTMSGKKESFAPVSSENVTVYVCGVTVYDLCHIGHARSAVAFDVIRRTLVWLGYHVTFVKNFTDIDDKIIRKANETGEKWTDITTKYILKHDEDMDALGVLRPTHAPRATQHIDDIIKFCETLIEKGNAYAVDGDVYFRVDSFPTYGKLSRRNLDDMQAGARIDINDKKENPMDFALWKAAKPDEPFWLSPWGNGRPGWHIECSVMSESILGTPIDIHGGGQDLIFPHHENEIAQSEAKCGCTFANYWVHNGFVNINKEKMSKSLGNFFTIQEILKDFDPEVLRFFLLTTHYRQPLEYADAKLIEAESSLERIYTLKDEIEHATSSKKGIDVSADIIAVKDKFYADFKSAMEDDFNTPSALAAVFDMVRGFNKVLATKINSESLALLTNTASDIFAMIESILHIAHKSAKDWFAAMLSMTDDELNESIQARKQARIDKNFAKADQIRDELVKKGVELIDTPEGTRYRTKRIHS